MSPPKRPSTLGGRDRLRSDTAGLAVPRPVVEEGTPPPQRIPVAPGPAVGRTPTPDDVRRLETKVNELVDAVGEVWDARGTRIDRLESELKDNTRATVRMEAVLDELVVPHVKEQMAKLDTCLHHIASSSHLAAAVVSLNQKMEEVGDQLGAIKTEQKLAADRFDAHDKRDQEMLARLVRVEGGMGELQQARALDDNTAKVKKMVARQRSWWFSAKGVSTVIAAVVAGVVAIIAATQGGCS